MTGLLHRALDRGEHGWADGLVDDRMIVVSGEGLDVSRLVELPGKFVAEGDSLWGRGLSWDPPRLFVSSGDPSGLAADGGEPSATPPPDVRIGPFTITGKRLTTGDAVMDLGGFTQVRPVGRSFVGPALGALIWPWVGWGLVGGLGVAGLAALTLGWFGWTLRQPARALRLEGGAGRVDVVLPDDLSAGEVNALTSVVAGIVQLGLPAAGAIEVLGRLRSGGQRRG